MTVLSRGSRLCEQIIRTATSRKGARSVGRRYLARRLGCSTRTVSRYVAELQAGGRLEVTPPPRVRTSRGWRCRGTNTYRLTRSPHPAPHVLGTDNRRSVRGDTRVTPLPNGSRGSRHGSPRHTPAGPLIDPTAAIAAMLGAARVIT